MPQPLQIDISKASKAFGKTRALRDVSLSLRGGEVHALMGENGAGKSTLIKVLAGLTRADQLYLRINGAPVALNSAEDAKRAGFRFIHQELDIVPQLSVAENIFLGQPYPRRFGALIDWPVLHAKARDALARLDVHHIDPAVQAATLSTGDQMLMRIASALTDDAGCLYVFDEPTAALSEADSARLFAAIKTLRARGVAVLYVSHRMAEVMALSDQVSVLRDGAPVMSAATAETRQDALITAMIGRSLAPQTVEAANTPHPDGPVPLVTALVTARGTCTQRLSHLDFEIRPGDILGIGGLARAGQGALLHMLCGLERVTGGTLHIENSPPPGDVSEAWTRGIAYVPRERRTQALLLKQSIRDNVGLAQIPAHAGPLGWRDRKQERRDAAALVADVGLKFEDLRQPVYQLSGGNQQKVVLARALSVRPRLLLLDEPTRGVDVGAKFEIHALLRRLAAQGCAIVLTSSDLPELIALSHRVLILQDGRQSALLPSAGLTPADLLARSYAPFDESQAS
ncbi:sugar ABC transporter ATP-binding protein [Primorskyibacter sp. S187A]|uniref:sugar ABC transporter ATP-binding protein n=1 Tax=Primorskyibacter sp. S187A TaxID=3415130 RepID=UPI003C7E0CD0